MKFGFFWRTMVYLAVLIFIGVFAWFRLMPTISVDNQSGQLLSQVVIELPVSRVTFDAVATAASVTIRHSPTQAEGRYNFIVVAADGQRAIGSCGEVKNKMYGWQLLVVVESGPTVRCEFPRMTGPTG